jgi:hypothetical protein
MASLGNEFWDMAWTAFMRVDYSDVTGQKIGCWGLAL